MNILQIITGLDYGGAETLLLDICKELKDRGHNISVIYLKSEGQLEVEFKNYNLEVKKVNIEKKNPLSVIYTICDFILKNEIDIVHTHLIHADIYGRISALLAGVDKIFTTLHATNNWRKETNLKAGIAKFFDKNLLNRLQSSSAIAISKAVKDFFVQYESLAPKKISVIPNAIKVDKKMSSKQITRDDLGVARDDFLIVNVGRLEEAKGQIYLLKAVHYLINELQINSLKCIIIGEGSQYRYLKEYLSENDLEEHIFMLGAKSNVYDYLKLANIFVMPSLWEGFGISILEAYLNELPVLATKVDGIVEVVKDPETGILVDSKDERLLAAEIMRFYEGAYDLERMAAQGKKRLAENYTIDSYINQLLQLYNS